jgi:tetratricopeptide (TPR) repeat protein
MLPPPCAAFRQVARSRSVRTEDANAAYKRAVDVDPKNALALYGYGHTSIELGNADEGIRAFRTFLQMQPNSAEGFANLAWGLNEAGRWMEAASAAKRAIELRYDLAAAHYSLGLANARLGNGPGALVEQSWLQQNNPEQAAELTAELVKIDLSYGHAGSTGNSSKGLAGLEPSYRQIDDNDSVLEDIGTQEPTGDSISLLGQTVDSPTPRTHMTYTWPRSRRPRSSAPGPVTTVSSW